VRAERRAGPPACRRRSRRRATVRLLAGPFRSALVATAAGARRGTAPQAHRGALAGGSPSANRAGGRVAYVGSRDPSFAWRRGVRWHSGFKAGCWELGAGS
jgi:hypothetical protein